jgi:transcriptional regulator with XRE-family HTH domain
MSGKMSNQNDSSTSMLSARKRTKKTRTTPSKPDPSLTAYGHAEVVSRHSSSRLTDLYRTEQFQTEWANNVPFHIARNLLHLRRYRGMSQQAVATAMGTSQSAVARIESAQENITLETLERHIGALDGQFYVSIRPCEFGYRPERVWWESLGPQPSTWGNWNVKGIASEQTERSHDVFMWLQRSVSSTLSNVILLLEAGTR